jgi:integron integrase
MSEIRLLDRVRNTIRALHYSRKTEQAYCYWIRFFIKFHRCRHPAQLDAKDISAFLTWLAVHRHVSASTQNQAFNAILFLYNKVLDIRLEHIEDVVRAKQSRRIPVVFSRPEVAAILSGLKQPYQLMAGLMYGGGLRIMETLRLRLKDVDFDRLVILVRQGKGNKDRVTILPEKLVPDIERAIARVNAIHQQDLAEGFGEVQMPYALARKYPKQASSLHWQFLFSGYTQTRELPHVPSLVCHSPAGGWIRHSHRSGLARPQRCKNHTDLHSRSETRWQCGAQSFASAQFAELNMLQYKY